MMGMRMSQLPLKRCSCYHEGAEAAEDSLLLLLDPILSAPEKRLGWRICCRRGVAASGRAVRDDVPLVMVLMSQIAADGGCVDPVADVLLPTLVVVVLRMWMCC